MIPEEIQRTMQFLLENQAAHDSRLAALEISVNKLTEATSVLVGTQQEMQGVVQDMQGVMQDMQGEFREGLRSILAVSEQTMVAVRQVAEAEARTIKRVSGLEARVDAIEVSGE